MDLLRQRQVDGRPPHPMRIDHRDENTFVLSPVCGGTRKRSERSAATRITVSEGKVSQMRRYRSRDHALGDT
jgi:hypothetical protein